MSITIVTGQLQLNRCMFSSVHTVYRAIVERSISLTTHNSLLFQAPMNEPKEDPSSLS
jgi:hypothetical protein